MRGYNVELVKATITNLLAQKKWLEAAEAILGARIFCDDPTWEIELIYLGAYVSFQRDSWFNAYRSAERVVDHYREQLAELSPELLARYYVAQAIELLARMAEAKITLCDSLTCEQHARTLRDDVAEARTAGRLPTDDAVLDELLDKLKI